MRPLEIINVGGWEKTNFALGGTRAKVAMRTSSQGKSYFMVKTPRRGMGENRSELIASNIGLACGIPIQEAQFCLIPQYESLFLDESSGICAKLVTRRWRGHHEEMVHGAQILSSEISGYRETEPRPKQYHIANIRKALIGYARKKGISLDELMFGFFRMTCFDALIGGSDRHHWNWAVVEENGRYLRFSELFDNGVSLLWDFENPDVRKKFLGRGQSFQSAHKHFLEKSKSLIRISEGEKGTHFDIIKLIGRWPEFKHAWAQQVMNCLDDLSDAKLKHAIIDRVPRHSNFGTNDETILQWIHEYVKMRHRHLRAVVESLYPFSWKL